MQFLICRQRKSWRLHFNPYLNICIFSGFLLVWCVAKTYRRKFRQQKPAFLLHEERWILNHFGFSFCFSYCTIKIKNVSNLPNSENAPVIKKRKSAGTSLCSGRHQVRQSHLPQRTCCTCDTQCSATLQRSRIYVDLHKHAPVSTWKQ